MNLCIFNPKLYQAIIFFTAFSAWFMQFHRIHPLSYTIFHIQLLSYVNLHWMAVTPWPGTVKVHVGQKFYRIRLDTIWHDKDVWSASYQILHDRNSIIIGGGGCYPVFICFFFYFFLFRTLFRHVNIFIDSHPSGNIWSILLGKSCRWWPI